MKIFLTGGTGYVGGNFLNYAIDNGHIVYALSRKKNNKKRKNLIWLQGSLKKKWKEFKKCDVLVHLASEGVYNKYPSFKNCFKANVTLPSKMLHNAAKSRCLDWVIVGSCFEKKIISEKKALKIVNKKNKIPFYNYAYSKYLFSNISLKIAKKYGANCRVLRLFHVYGGNENQGRLWPSLITAAKKNQDFYMTKGEQIRDYLYIKDFIDGIVKCLNNEKAYGEIINIASGKPISIKEVILMVNEIIAKGEPIFGGINYREGESMELYANIDKAKEILNWEPKYNFKSCLKKVINWYAENP